MGKFTFNYKSGEAPKWANIEIPETEITYTTDAEGLSTLLEDIKHFLQGCGYVINGELIVNEYPEPEDLDVDDDCKCDDCSCDECNCAETKRFVDVLQEMVDEEDSCSGGCHCCT